MLFPVLVLLAGIILVVVATLLWRRVEEGNHFSGIILSTTGAIGFLLIASIAFYIKGQTSIFAQLQNGEEAKVLAMIPAADSLVINEMAFAPPATYSYVLVLKNKENKERREFWEKPDTVRVGDRIGRLESGLILVQTANTGSASLAAR